MKRVFMGVTALLVILLIVVAAQATPERAAITGKSCGECHSGGRHMGNK